MPPGYFSEVGPVSNDFHNFLYNWLELRSFLLWKLHLVSCLGHLFEPFKCLNVVYRSSVSAVYAICWKELNYCAMFKETGVLIFTANLMLMIEFETFLNFKTFCCISSSTSWVMYYDVMMCVVCTILLTISTCLFLNKNALKREALHKAQSV